MRYIAISHPIQQFRKGAAHQTRADLHWWRESLLSYGCRMGPHSSYILRSTSVVLGWDLHDATSSCCVVLQTLHGPKKNLRSEPSSGHACKYPLQWIHCNFDGGVPSVCSNRRPIKAGCPIHARRSREWENGTFAQRSSRTDALSRLVWDCDLGRFASPRTSHPSLARVAPRGGFIARGARAQGASPGKNRATAPSTLPKAKYCFRAQHRPKHENECQCKNYQPDSR